MNLTTLFLNFIHDYMNANGWTFIIDIEVAQTILKPLTEDQFAKLQTIVRHPNVDGLTYKDYYVYVMHIMDYLGQTNSVDFVNYVKVHDYTGSYFKDFRRVFRPELQSMEAYTVHCIFAYQDFIESICKQRNITYNVASYRYNLEWRYDIPPLWKLDPLYR